MIKYLFIILFLIIGIGIYFNIYSTPNDNVLGKKQDIKNISNKPKNVKELKIEYLQLNIPDEENLSDLVKRIIGFTDELGIHRNQLIYDLKRKGFSDKDFQALLAFVNHENSHSNIGLSLYSIKNDLIVLLIDDGRFRHSVGEVMNNIVNDPGHSEILREYATQYFPDYFFKNWTKKFEGQSYEVSDLPQVDIMLQEKLIKSLFDATKKHNGPIAGTALISLNELSKKFHNINKAKIKSISQQLILDASQSVSTRMASLSLAPELKLEKLSPDIQNIAIDESNPVMLRMAALNSWSQLDHSVDFQLIVKKNFLQNDLCDSRLKKAAEMIAINKNYEK